MSVARTGPKGLSYYPADHAATLWYASSELSKSMDVQTFDWDVTFEGLAGPQPLLQVRATYSAYKGEGSRRAGGRQSSAGGADVRFRTQLPSTALFLIT